MYCLIPGISGIKQYKSLTAKNTNSILTSVQASAQNEDFFKAMIQDEVDFLLLSPASTTGWDTVLKDAQAAGITHGVDGDVIVMGFDCNK